MSTAEYPGGTVYLLHLDPAYKHARHYTGYAEPGNLQGRLAAHAAGTGARLMQVIKEAGGTFRLARTWPGGRTRERELKNRRDAPRLCPICTEHPKPAQGRAAQRQRPVRTPAPAPQQSQPARPPAYERGAASARRLIQQQIDAGFSTDRIAEAQARILSALIPERLRPEGREEARGYRETAEAMITATNQPVRNARMQNHEPGSWLARDVDGRIREVDADGYPGAEASPFDSRPVAEADTENSPIGRRDAWLDAQQAAVADDEQKVRDYARLAGRLSGDKAEQAARMSRFCAGMAEEAARTPVPDFAGWARDLEAREREAEARELEIEAG